MKFLLLIFCFMLTSQMSLLAQDTILVNKRYTLNTPAIVFTGLEATDSCFFISAVAYDTMLTDPSTVILCSFLAKMDTLGNLLFSKQIIGNEQTYEFWGKGTLQTTADGNLAVLGYSYDWSVDTLPTVMFLSLFKFMPNGDTLWARKYSLNLNDPFFFSDDLVVAPNGDFLIGATHREFGNNNGEALLIRTDSQGNMKWNRAFTSSSVYVHSPRLEEDIDSNFILSYYGQLPYYKKIDSIGAQIWTFTPLFIGSGVGSANDIVLTRDSGYVFGTSKQVSATGGIPDYNAYVFKFKNGEGVKWGKELRADIPTSAISIRRLAEFPNGNIVASGIGGELATNTYTIWVNLLSADGDSLWSKDYYPVGAGTDVNYLHEHIVYDMELTSSGYLVLCGETRSTYHPEPQQQGFLLKIGIPTDTTQLQSAQQAIGSDGFYMRLYPNPAQDYTIIDFSTALGEQENYRIFISNAQGQVLRDIPVQSANSGYIVDVAGLAAGVYYVSVLRGGQVLRTEKLVKQ